MSRACLILLVCIISAAGCITEEAVRGMHPDLLLVTPAEPFPLFGDQAMYSAILDGDTLSVPVHYSTGLVTIPPGKATPPHRLLGTTELIAVLSGGAIVHGDGATVIAAPGSLVLLPPDTLQSIEARGDADLVYLTVVQPPFTPAIEIREGDHALLTMESSGVPLHIPGPEEGIVWDYETGARIVTLANPVLMPDADLPVSYSVAFIELLPGGYIDMNRLAGSSELLYVVSGEIAISSPGGSTIVVPAGSAGYVPPDQVKGYRNTAPGVSRILTIVDPAWSPEITIMEGT